MAQSGPSLGIVGALEAFPQRLAARAVTSRGGRLRRGVTRQTQRVVVGRRLLRLGEAEIEAKLAILGAANVRLLSENGFLRWLHLLETPDASRPDPPRRSCSISRSSMKTDLFDRLALFDAFEHDAEPFSFRDLIQARKYAGLIAGGASWSAVARSVHHAGPRWRR